MNNNSILPIDTITSIDLIPDDNSSNQATAKKAASRIAQKMERCYKPTNQERSLICIEFAKKGKVVYGKSFDLFQLGEGFKRNDIEKAIKSGNLKLLEVKSTKNEKLKNDFKGYFFSMSTAELLVAQSLGGNYQFVLFNVATDSLKLMTLADIYKNAKALYPTWSIRF